MRKNPEHYFRGNRDYLTGAAVFDGLLGSGRGRTGRIDFVFNVRTGNQITIQDEQPSEEDVQVGSWIDDQGKLYIIEREEKITKSVDYDEALLISDFVFSEKQVEIPEVPEGFTFIEAVVAGFKHLLLRYHVGSDRKVVFVRIRLKSIPAGSVWIDFRRRIGEFFQADIANDDGIVGQMFFGEWK